MMKCKLCGFIAKENPKARAGSMALHAKMKHGEADYTKIFEEVEGAAAPPAENKKPAAKMATKKEKSEGTWRLLNPNKPEEKAAIAAGFTKVCVKNGVDPSEWDIA